MNEQPHEVPMDLAARAGAEGISGSVNLELKPSDSSANPYLALG